MRNFICSAMILCIIACLLTGCASEETIADPGNVVCVVGITNNNPKVDPAIIRELTSLAARPGSTYTVINAEGEPRVICSGQIRDLSNEGYSQKMMERVTASVAAGIRGKINEAVPETPEVDIAAATVQAVRCLQAQQTDDRGGTLVYYLSGISTCGLIDMVRVPVYRMDVEASVQAVIDTLKLDLNGIDVVMYCCGDTAGDNQSKLSFEEQNKLKNFYQLLFLGMGAKSVTFMEELPGDACYDFAQPVSVMETEGNVGKLLGQVTDAASEEAVQDVFAEGEILAFDDKSIAFLPESTVLEDPDAAREALSYVVAYMLDNPDFELLICGTTTSAGEESSCRAFSEKRAEAIQELLIGEPGIEAGRVSILGCGYSSMLYIPDGNTDGKLDETVAPLNRSVKLLDLNSEMAESIRQSLPQN